MERLLRELQAARPKETIYIDTNIDNDPILLESEPSEDEGGFEIGESDIEDDEQMQWLQKQCKDIAVANGMESQQIVDLILSSLKSSNDSQLQSQLVDIIGFDHLDFITEIFARQEELRTLAESLEGVGLSKKEREAQYKENRAAAAAKAATLEWIGANGGAQEYPNIYRRNAKQVTSFGGKYVLPQGTTRETLPLGETVTIPAPPSSQPVFTGPLLQVKDIDDEACRITFSQYKTLNRVQSLVFPAAFETNENMLICAPTGAGKTDVALISILKSLKDFGLETKIVYVAPLKALAAEITEKLGSRLGWMQVRVRELTGDMQLTRAEIAETHIIVTTPEKWDVVTRKPNDDSGLAAQIRLLIIDEVHLLHEDRGAVIESLVARTLRQVESQQALIRIVGLSATLPNFVDVAEFLRVNPYKGLFFFDSSFRPCPLEQIFSGVKGKAGSREAIANLDTVAYEHLKRQLSRGKSVMVFVHSRKDTVNAAKAFMKSLRECGDDPDIFKPTDPSAKDAFSRDMSQHNWNSDIKELFEQGFGIHHAGLTRAERNLSERMFLKGAIRVLCCTATLAWGVNLPAAVVIIKGTQVYNAAKGGYTDLGISDVIQIFGRAGRPQFEKFGTGILCTSADRLDHYLSAITHQYPIESRLQGRLVDNLNAEISLGTITSVSEAITWLGYTYLYVRMRKAPQAYGLKPGDVKDDPALVIFRRQLVLTAARRLSELQMIVFDEDDETESLISKDLGRIASDFYLLNASVEKFNKTISPQANETQFLQTLSQSEEFDGIKVRQEEQNELDGLLERIPYGPRSKGGAAGKVNSAEDKTNVLIQAYISQLVLKDASLGNDVNYVSQNSARIARAYFLLCLSRRWGRVAQFSLDIDKALKRRQWPEAHPLLQFEMPQTISRQISAKNLAIEDLKTLSARELGDLIHNVGWGPKLHRIVSLFPLLTIAHAEVKPITSSVVRVELELRPEFRWDHNTHGGNQLFWVWVMEDSDSSQILHCERVILNSYSVKEPQRFDFAIPIQENHAKHVVVRVISDQWLGSESVAPLPFEHLVPPGAYPIRTQLLRLRPLPVSALHNPQAEKFYGSKFSFFNPMQTMVFHSMYNEASTSVLLGSPTGSGKTVACELAVWAALRDRPTSKVVYIAPMKALVKERVQDWKKGLCKAANLRLVELTGDTNPGGEAVRNANILITTPEKFDGISRNWQSRTKFVQSVSLVIMDEVHLLASDRGAILEMIVSRMNHMSDSLKKPVRLLGMSTAVANAGDLASWLGIKNNIGLFNFPSSVRPVPLEMYIDGFPDLTGFCPFMKSMNKSVYLAIKRHAPVKPALVFVPSRRQTRLTAQDLISLCGQEDTDNPRRWLHMTEEELSSVLDEVEDEALKLSLQFGIAIHHAGLVDSDRSIAHRLFATGKVQVLVATSTLAWGVNLPAYLVIVKGTQFFDAKINKYKDMDLTDVLQMMGRAGRPAYDTSGVAMVFTKQSTKSFYKYFLNLGFPVESSLHLVLADHIGAEIANESISNRQEILDFLTRTFLFRRVHSNPSYYGITDNDPKTINKWLVNRVDECLEQLKASRCLISSSASIDQLAPTAYLRIASYYYISHKTMRLFLNRLPGKYDEDVTDCEILQCLALASEYDELAIRHNEDLQNSELSQNVEYHGSVLGLRMVDPHVKAFLLVQARMHRVGLPIEDYIQDTITVLDQAIRILQALIDTAAQLGLVKVCVRIIRLLRCIKQAVLPNENMVKILPGLTKTKSSIKLRDVEAGDARKLHVPRSEQAEFSRVVKSLPRLRFSEAGDAIIKPTSKPVYCPHFHKPQAESWFVLLVQHGVLKSIERVQRNKTLKKPSPDEGHLYIMNDTVEMDYEL